jgi:hypothetical protein
MFCSWRFVESNDDVMIARFHICCGYSSLLLQLQSSNDVNFTEHDFLGLRDKTIVKMDCSTKKRVISLLCPCYIFFLSFIELQKSFVIYFF